MPGPATARKRTATSARTYARKKNICRHLTTFTLKAILCLEIGNISNVEGAFLVRAPEFWDEGKTHTSDRSCTSSASGRLLRIRSTTMNAKRPARGNSTTTEELENQTDTQVHDNKEKRHDKPLPEYD